jgi:hypothetical protein
VDQRPDQEPTTQPETPGAKPKAKTPSGAWGRGARGRIVVAVVAVAVFVLLFVSADAVASSPDLCAGCHLMQPWVASWRVSAHANVECYSCHGTPRPWYAEPVSVIERWSRIGRDVRAQSVMSSAEASSAIAKARPVPDWVCEQCHNLATLQIPSSNVTIDHTKHAKRNKSCVSCHTFVAHPERYVDRNTSLMKQCFVCHGQTKAAKAPGRCSLCHPKDFELKPPSHIAPKWLQRHGAIAKANRQQCDMCHAPEFCVKCHGLVMPHPTGWAGGPNLHATVAKKGVVVCERCHKGSSELCTMCHHRGFAAGKGPWVKQHPAMAAETGSAFCFQCHDSMFCVKCHTTTEATPIDATQ